MVEDLNVAGNQLLRREFSRLKFDKRNSKRIEASLKAWANEELRLVRRFRKAGGQILSSEKFCLRLPLSGARLKIIGEQGEWELIKPSEMDTSGSEFKGFPVEVHCIDQFRNDKEYEEMYSDEAIVLLLRALNLVHEFAKTLEEGNLCDTNGKTHFLFVEKCYWALLISLESLHLPLILKNLRVFIESHSQVATRVSLPLIATAGKMAQTAKNQLDRMKQSFDGFLKFTKSLKNLEADGHLDGRNSVIDIMEVGKYVEQLIEVYRNNHMGSKLFRISTDQRLVNIFSDYDYEPVNIKKGGPEFDLLNTQLSSSLQMHICLRLRQPSRSLEETENSVFIEIDTIEEGLRVRMKELYLDKFRAELKKYHHLIDGVPDDAKEKIMVDITRLESFVKTLEIKTVTERIDFPSLLAILQMTPSYWQKRVNHYGAQYQLDSKWNDRIQDLERILGIQGLIESLKDQIGVAQIEQKLRFIIQRAEANELNFQRQIRTIEDQSKVDKLSSGGDKEYNDLMEGKRNLKRKSDEMLRNIEKSEAGQALSHLDAFIREVGEQLDIFSDLIDSSNTMFMPSDGVGTLLIGLGQGGQQILRAVMANLLNTTSDSRSRNMLHGLGFAEEDITDIENIRKKTDNFAEPDERTKMKLERLFGSKANLLAINLGPELEQLLRQPYSYIWGKAGDSQYRQYNDELTRRPSPNLMLLDPDSQGAGGRMGKGRAFAFTSRDAIRKALELYKERGRNITQVAVIHSFAGGSGSGMILPLLGECKLSYPSADIWVLSAGDEKNAAGAYTPHNVSYITSEVLQSHYNALHHRTEPLTSMEWSTFSTKGQNLQREMGELWKKISPCLERDSQVESKLQSSLTSYNRALKVIPDGSHSGFEPMQLLDRDGSVQLDCFTIVPSGRKRSQDFHNGLVDTHKDEFFHLWERWVKTAEDPANLWGKNLIADKESSGDERGGLRYHLNYGDLRTLATLLKKRHQVDDESEFREKLSEDEYQAISKGIKDVARDAKISNIEDEEQIETMEELADMLIQYAIKMQEYHYNIYGQSERILMNRGVMDDTLIKHVVISNAHLDMGVNFYDGNEPSYEIYNSTMAEVFVNVVHAMVSNDEGSLHDAGSTHEVMDVSDMRRRTKPPLTAVILDPIATSELTSIVQYTEHDFKTYEDSKGTPHRMFELFFSHRSSPLFAGEELRANLGFRGEGLRALFTIYFGGKDSGMFKIDPRDIIDCYRETLEDPVWHPYSNDQAMGQAFYEALKNDGSHQLEIEELERSYDFTILETTNMLRWIRLIPIDVICGFLAPEDDDEGSNQELFRSKAKHWADAQSSILSYDGANPKLRKGTRNADFINLIGEVFGMEVEGSHRKELTDLLMKLGLLDISHLSAVPSSYLIEPAPWLLTPKDMIFSGQQATRFQMMRHIGTPTAFYRSALTKLRNKRDDSEIVKSVMKENFSDANLLTLFEDTEHGVSLIQLRIEAIEWLARLKISAAELSPEFCNQSLFDLMISSSSNPESASMVREPSETPVFRQSREVFNRMAMVRPLYHNEPQSLTALRICLMGLAPGKANSSENALRKAYLSSLGDISWISSIQAIGSYDFGSNFKPNDFSEVFINRLRAFSKVPLPSSSEITTSTKVLRLVQIRLEEIINIEEEAEDKELRTILDDLNRELITKPLSELLEEAGLIESEKIVDSQAIAIGNFLSKVSNALFQSQRQHSFLNHQMRGGEGVAFGLTGSVDAYRSKPDDYMVIINTSTGVKAEQIKRVVNDFFKLYIRPKQNLGKVFIQHISGGPLASFTILMQRTGPIEIADNMARVFKDLDSRQLATATRTLVHPYSFLRNILWMTTFHGNWLNEPSQQYLNALKVPIGVVRKVYANPALIEQAIESVRQSGDMTSQALPELDNQYWNGVGDIWSKDNTVKLARQRGVLHVPDMLAINYLREKYPDEFNDYLTANLIDSELESIYPISLWKEFFKNKGINEQSVGNFKSDVVEVESISVSSNPFANANPFNTSSASNNNDSIYASADDWFVALTRWCERYKDGRNDSMRTSMKIDYDEMESISVPTPPVVNIPVSVEPLPLPAKVEAVSVEPLPLPAKVEAVSIEPEPQLAPLPPKLPDISNVPIPVETPIETPVEPPKPQPPPSSKENPTTDDLLSTLTWDEPTGEEEAQSRVVKEQNSLSLSDSIDNDDSWGKE